MTCDCKQNIQDMLTDNFKEAAPEATGHAAELQGYTLIIGRKLVEKGCMEIHRTATHPLKKGGVKEKTEKLNMVFTYCPFCGVKYDGETA